MILNSYDVVKEAYVKLGSVIAGRPQDLFFVESITEGYGMFVSQVYLSMNGV